MRSNKIWTSLLLSLFVFGLVACSDDSAQTPDAGPTQDMAPAIDQAPPQPDQAPPPPTSYKVAGVQYSSGNFAALTDSACSDDVCGLTHLIKEAVGNGAHAVVIPEAVLDQDTAERAPDVGDDPSTDTRWTDGSLIKHFSALAKEVKATLVAQMVTQEGDNLYNTSTAFDADGKVLARHFKFQLFGGESNYYVPGPDINRAFFETPAGRAGLMVCADAQCLMVASFGSGFQVTPDCTAHAIDMTKEYFLSEKKPELVFFSAFWTVGTGAWAAMNVQKTVAEQAQVWLIAANNTAGPGRGGGIYKPGGEMVDSHQAETPGIIYAELPLK